MSLLEQVVSQVEALNEYRVYGELEDRSFLKRN
jgi:hypothetical protein